MSTMSEPRVVKGLRDLLPAHDAFILDVWGTVYDGLEAFPGVVACLERLRETGKRVAFLSNAPQLPSTVAGRLERIGILPTCYDLIVTSGGVTRARLESEDDELLQDCRGRVYQTGPERFPDTLARDRFEEVDSVEKADWILNSGPAGPHDRIEDYEDRLRIGAARGLPMVCANPDRIVSHGGDIQICAGTLAERYEALGGKAHYIGKPYPGVFEQCAKALGVSDPTRVLMIGDNLETDILGANRVGFPSLLVASGVHDLAAPDGSIRQADLDALAQRYGAKPDYVSGMLAW